MHGLFVDIFEIVGGRRLYFATCACGRFAAISPDCNLLVAISVEAHCKPHRQKEKAA